MKDLSVKELKFIEKFIECDSYAKAAVHAGYSQNGAARAGLRLLQRTRVKDKIDALKKQLEITACYSRDRMFKEIAEIADKAALDRFPNYSAILKAKEMQCKMLGYFEPEKEEIKSMDISISVLDDGSKREEPKNIQEAQVLNDGKIAIAEQSNGR